MTARVRTHPGARRTALSLPALAATLVLLGCGSAAKHPARAANAGEPGSPNTPAGCPATVMKTLGRIVERVYHEGVHSQRTGSASYLVRTSTALREAVEADDPAAARAAARQLLSTGHLTNLLVTRDGRTLVDAGGPALTPVRGTITAADGKPLASYVTSVWSDTGFMAEVGGVIQGYSALMVGHQSLPGSFGLGSKHLPGAGTITRGGVAYQYTSFTGEAFPAGPVRIYLVRARSTMTPLCATNGEATVIKTLEHVANLIYVAEHSAPAARQVVRVEHNRPLLEAVAHRDVPATVAAIDALLNHHIVRLRVFAAGGELLGDVGGPYVLAPVHGSLRLGGRAIGSFVLSVQDDEGYEKLAKRLEGLDVLVYMGSQIVKNSLGPVTGAVPANGPYSYHGRSFRVFTVRGVAFPAGPLVIRVLVPLPYFSQPVD